VEVDSKDLLSSNAARYDRYEDMAQMGELNEACVLDNLKQRYSSNLIYVMELFK
jgi:myosin heavy subunit